MTGITLMVTQIKLMSRTHVSLEHYHSYLSKKALVDRLHAWHSKEPQET